jgi:hypothetical protein
MSTRNSKNIVPLWPAWWGIVSQLRPAFARSSTFLWFAVALAATCVRSDLRGVTSFVRALGLAERCYGRLLDMFHSTAVRRDQLPALWSRLALSLLKPFLFLVNDRMVLLADGIKAPKTGRRMPGVKKLHQESQNNSKPEFIFGHSCQAIAVVARAAAGFFAVPLACAIHEGVVFSNRDKRTLLDKLVIMLRSLGIALPYYLVGDIYYAARTVIGPLLAAGQHLVSAVRSNAVAYFPPEEPAVRRRGRPRKYGRKVVLKSLFAETASFVTAPSPVYGERDVTILMRVLDLHWKPAGRLVRFVLVIHPNRGRRIFLCTDTTLEGIEVVRIYGVRFKIEVTFKHAVHSVGTWCYHFWMAGMKPLKRRSGNQHVHKETARYRQAVRRKLGAYHSFLQMAVIAQGLLQMLAILHPDTVWRRFGSWLRTVRPGVAPSEQVVALALRECLPEFIAGFRKTNPLAEIISENLDIDRAEGWRLAS